MKFVKGSGLVLLVGMVTQVHAEGPVLAEGMMSIGLPIFSEDRRTYILTGKQMISSDAAIVVSAGAIVNNDRNRNATDPVFGTDRSTDKAKDKTYYASAGYRRYLDREWVNTYWESSGHLGFGDSTVTSQDCSTVCSSQKITSHYRSVGATIRVGGEHFFSRQFSVEGSAGVTFDYSSDREKRELNGQALSSSKQFSNRIGSNFSSLNLNYYWK